MNATSLPVSPTSVGAGVARGKTTSTEAGPGRASEAAVDSLGRPIAAAASEFSAALAGFLVESPAGPDCVPAKGDPGVGDNPADTPTAVPEGIAGNGLQPTLAATPATLVSIGLSADGAQSPAVDGAPPSLHFDVQPAVSETPMPTPAGGIPAAVQVAAPSDGTPVPPGPAAAVPTPPEGSTSNRAAAQPVSAQSPVTATEVSVIAVPTAVPTPGTTPNPATGPTATSSVSPIEPPSEQDLSAVVVEEIVDVEPGLQGGGRPAANNGVSAPAPVNRPDIAAIGPGTVPTFDTPVTVVTASTPPPSGTSPVPTSASADAVALREGPVSAQIARQVAVLRGTPDGSYTMTVQVTPDDLGPVSIQVTVENGALELTLRGAHEHGRAALAQAMPELRRDLETAGLMCNRVEVDPDLDHSSWFSSQPDAGETQRERNTPDRRTRSWMSSGDNDDSNQAVVDDRSTPHRVDVRM